VKDPQRNLPRALVGGVLIVLAAYLLVSALFLYLVPLGEVTSDQAFVAQIGQKMFGARGEQWLAGVVVLSIVSSLAALMLASPRVYVAMAADGVFLKSIAATSSRTGAPVRAILLQVVLSCTLVLIGTFETIISYFIFTAVLFIGAAAAAVVRLERRGEVSLRFGYPFTPILFLLLIVALLALLMISRPYQALLGLAITACGLPLSFLFRPTKVAPTGS
jgi:APA family basic amino acid/polyamine antiporter